MEQEKFSFIKKFISSPLLQTAVFIAVTILLNILLAFDGDTSSDSLYFTAGFVFMAYMLFNTIAMIFAKSYWKYLLFSLVSIVIYLTLSGLIVQIIIDAAGIEGSHEASIIFLVVIYYPIGVILGSILYSIKKSRESSHAQNKTESG